MEGASMIETFKADYENVIRWMMSDVGGDREKKYIWIEIPDRFVQTCVTCLDPRL